MVVCTIYYDFIEVRPDASTTEIRKQYRKLAFRWHPDKHLDPADKQAAEEIFKNITEAYRVLSDQTLRKEYDMYGLDDGYSSSDEEGAATAAADPSGPVEEVVSKKDFYDPKQEAILKAAAKVIDPYYRSQDPLEEFPVQAYEIDYDVALQLVDYYEEEIQDVQRRCAAKAKHLEENDQRIKEVVKLVEDLRKAVWDVWESNGKTKDGKFNISSVVSSLQREKEKLEKKNAATKQQHAETELSLKDLTSQIVEKRMEAVLRKNEIDRTKDLLLEELENQHRLEMTVQELKRMRENEIEDAIKQAHEEEEYLRVVEKAKFEARMQELEEQTKMKERLAVVEFAEMEKTRKKLAAVLGNGSPGDQSNHRAEQEQESPSTHSGDTATDLESQQVELSEEEELAAAKQRWTAEADNAKAKC